jgi:hypothetical protein
MDKIDLYLDQVCRGIAGPRSLRQHIRQELREHLLDAVAVHRAAGLSEEQAIARALDDFGGPEEVRGEMETLHGHRLLTTVVDKSLEWKEKTMKARWLWTTLAHLTLATLIILDSFFIAWIMIFLVPSYIKVHEDGLLEAANTDVQAYVDRADAMLMTFVRAANNLSSYWPLWTLLLIVVWGLFEWRVHNENKSLMRLSALGLAALVLTISAGLTGASLLVPYVVALPTLYAQSPEPIVRDDTAAIAAALERLEKSVAARDWTEGELDLSEAWSAINDLANRGAAAPALLSRAEQPKIDQLRVALQSASQSMNDIQTAIRAKDPERVSATLKTFRDTYQTAVAEK